MSINDLKCLSSNVDNPVILFIGRNGKDKKNSIESELDDNKEMYNLGIRVFTVNIEELTLPDFLCDFNSSVDREMLITNILSPSARAPPTGGKKINSNIIMIIFDISVFKFITNIREMFSDIKKMLIPGGIFITEYNSRGGCFIFSNIITMQITDLNILEIPSRFSRYEIISLKNEIKAQSQQLILNELFNHFEKVTLKNDELYPFFVNYKTSFYVCIRDNNC